MLGRAVNEINPPRLAIATRVSNTEMAGAAAMSEATDMFSVSAEPGRRSRGALL